MMPFAIPAQFLLALPLALPQVLAPPLTGGTTITPDSGPAEKAPPPSGVGVGTDFTPNPRGPAPKGPGWGGPGDQHNPGPVRQPGGGGQPVPASGPAGGGVQEAPVSHGAPGMPAPANSGGRGADIDRGPAAPLTGLETLDDGIDLTAWSWWWELNREPYLDLKRRIQSSAAISGDDDFFLGLEDRTRARPATRPSEHQLEHEVLPALREILAKETQPDIVTAALIAIARLANDLEPAKRGEWEEVLVPWLASGSQAVAERAALAIGILGDDRSCLLLGDLLLDQPRGRAAVGRQEVTPRTRAFAAYGLGLMGERTQSVDVQRYAVHQLALTLERCGDTWPEVSVACVLSLGLVPIRVTGEFPEDLARKKDRYLPSASRESLVLYLLDVLDDDEQHRLVRANVPLSLGRLTGRVAGKAGIELRERVADRLLDVFKARSREPREVVQSAVIALGMLADGDGGELDEACLRALTKIGETTSDRLALNLAQVSLAHIGARRGDSDEDDPPGRKDVRKHLLSTLSRGNANVRAWAALALGILSRETAAGGDVPTDDIGAALRDALESGKSPSEVGGASVALGLAGVLAAEEDVLARYVKGGDDETRAHAAVGLGLMGALQAANPITATVQESAFRPLLLRESVIALGLLGQRDAVPMLVTMLADAGSLASQTAIATGLGRIGDARAVEPLLALVRDDRFTARSRAFAIAALGLVGDRDPLPWSTPLSVDCNWAAAPPTLFDFGGTGVLNIP